ncbi:MAG: hypothetical protein IPK26_31445 [Planctomycetes bacterium]|nr:hypothetical protein [Planctomycetota bacterium]
MLTRASLFGILATGLTGQTIVQSWALPYANAFVGGVALDHIHDSVWVVDETNDLITQFSRTGSQIAQFAPPVVPGIASPQPIGVKVHPLTGNLWIIDEAEVVYEMTRTGALVTSFSARPAIIDASAIAIDVVNARLWVSNDSARILAEFDFAGTNLSTVALTGAGSVDPDGLTYNPVNDHFYLGEDTGDQILEVDRTGALVQAFALGSLPISPEGIDIDTRSGTFFIGGGLAQRSVFEVAGIITPGPGMTTVYGTGCTDSGGSVPVTQVSVTPRVGSTVIVGMQGSTSVATFGWFVIGLTRTTVPLAPFGGAPCVLNNDPFAVTPPFLATNGRAAFALN